MIEFERQFATEEACQEYLYQIRWPPGFICPCCGHSEFWSSKIDRYRCRPCEQRVSVKAGTIFQESRIPLRLWFRAIWQMVSQKPGISALGLKRVWGLKSYQTTWRMMHKLRKAMVRPGRERLPGPGQVDETSRGGVRSGKRGRGAAGKTLGLVAVEDQDGRPGRIRLPTVEDASGDSLIPAVQESGPPQSEIRTDGWEGYNKLSSCGYTRTIIRETAEVGKNLLPLANRVASLLQRWLIGTHQGKPSPAHLDYSLDEFVFRFNRRTSRSRGLLLHRLIQQAVDIAPVRGQDIGGGQH